MNRNAKVATPRAAATPSVGQAPTEEPNAARRRTPLAELSHELRSPLALIQNYCEILVRHPPSDEEQRADFLRTVADEAERLNGLLNDLIELERLESGTLALDSEPCDLEQLVERVILAESGTARDLGIDLGYEASAAGSVAIRLGDRRLLERAVRALVDNAVKFSPQGERVRVRLHARRDRVRIEVDDRGIGVPEADVERIFDKLYRASPPPDPRSPPGSGLGLTLARSIARRHGGDVRYRRRRQGSRFLIELPLGE